MNEIKLIVTPFGKFIGKFNREKKMIEEAYNVANLLSPNKKPIVEFQYVGKVELYCDYMVVDVPEGLRREYLKHATGIEIAKDMSKVEMIRNQINRFKS